MKKCTNCNSTQGMVAYVLFEAPKEWVESLLPGKLHYCPECSSVYTEEEYAQLEAA